MSLLLRIIHFSAGKMRINHSSCIRIKEGTVQNRTCHSKSFVYSPYKTELKDNWFYLQNDKITNWNIYSRTRTKAKNTTLRSLFKSLTIIINATELIVIVQIWPELGTFEWWISGLRLDPLFFLVSRLNNACSLLVIDLQNRSGLRISHSEVFSSDLIR